MLLLKMATKGGKECHHTELKYQSLSLCQAVGENYSDVPLKGVAMVLLWWSFNRGQQRSCLNPKKNLMVASVCTDMQRARMQVGKL